MLSDQIYLKVTKGHPHFSPGSNPKSSSQPPVQSDVTRSWLETRWGREWRRKSISRRSLAEINICQHLGRVNCWERCGQSYSFITDRADQQDQGCPIALEPSILYADYKLLQFVYLTKKCATRPTALVFFGPNLYGWCTWYDKSNYFFSPCSWLLCSLNFTVRVLGQPFYSRPDDLSCYHAERAIKRGDKCRNFTAGIRHVLMRSTIGFWSEVEQRLGWSRFHLMIIHR